MNSPVHPPQGRAVYFNESFVPCSLFPRPLHHPPHPPGDLEHRAQLREPANILIFNATRTDTAEYRCEVAAIDDQRDFDEILISLAVRGTDSIVLPFRIVKAHRFLPCSII